MPRPGSKPKITFASDERVSRFPELRDNFIKEVLQLEWALVTDESSLWDFHTDTDNRNMYLKIAGVYGVDVSHIISANLADILNGIMDEIGTFPEDDISKAIRLGRDARARYNMGLPRTTVESVSITFLTGLLNYLTAN